MVLRDQQGADVARQYGVGAVGALDRLLDRAVGAVNQLAHFAADGLLQAGKGAGVGVDTRIGGVPRVAVHAL
jgi:hypothetical protein